METAVEDDAGRDAGPDAEEDQVVDSAELLLAVEPDRSGAHVVLDDARDAERGLEPLSERQVLPAEVDGERHVARRPVDAPGDAEPDRDDVGHRRAGLVDRVADDARDLVDRFVRLGGRGGHRPSGEHAVVRRNDEDGDLAPADVDTDADRTARRAWIGWRRSSDEAQPELAGDEERRRAADHDVRRRPDRPGCRRRP